MPDRIIGVLKYELTPELRARFYHKRTEQIGGHGEWIVPHDKSVVVSIRATDSWMLVRARSCSLGNLAWTAEIVKPNITGHWPFGNLDLSRRRLLVAVGLVAKRGKKGIDFRLREDLALFGHLVIRLLQKELREIYSDDRMRRKRVRHFQNLLLEFVLIRHRQETLTALC